MRDEPRRHPVYMLLLGLASLGTVPVAFVGTRPLSWLGLPVWLWSSAASTLALSALIAWGALRYWRDDD
jgi:hypothetical protein